MQHFSKIAADSDDALTCCSAETETATDDAIYEREVIIRNRIEKLYILHIHAEERRRLSHSILGASSNVSSDDGENDGTRRR